MAKKEKFNIDPLGSLDDLNLPDFDFDDSSSPKRGKGKRDPVMEFAQGALTGAKSAATSSPFIRNAIKKSLPDGYGETMNAVSDFTGNTRNLYNEVTNAAKPAILDARRATKKLLPMGEKFLPRKARDILRNFANGGENSSGSSWSKDQARDLEVNRITTEIFKYQTETSERQRAEDEVKDRIKDTIDHKRFATTAKILEGIRIATHQNTAFHTKIGAAYMRKSLELQYRQYYLLHDIFEEAKTTNVKTVQRLEAIAKNTALPDYVKLTKTEYVEQYLAQVMGNKFVNSTGNFITQRKQFINNVMKSLGKTALGRVKDVFGNIQSGLSMADMMADSASMATDMGVSGHRMAGEMSGGILMDLFGDKLLKPITSRIKNAVQKNPKLVRYGNNGSYFLGNTQQIARNWSKSYTQRPGVLGWLENLAKESIRGASPTYDTAITTDKRGMLGQPAVFNRRTQKSIEEIIPGFLARIHHELKIIRTGDESASLMAYDFTTNRFADAGKVRGASLNQVFNKSSRENTQIQMDRLIKTVDPQGKLSPEQRKALGQHLLKANVNETLASQDTFTSHDFYKGFGKQDQQQFAGIFRDYYQGDETGAKRNELAGQFNSLGSNVSEIRYVIQEMINDGELATLEDAGIVKDGEIQMSVVYDYFGGKNITSAQIKTLPQKIKTGRTGGFQKARHKTQRSTKPIHVEVDKTFNRATTNNYASNNYAGNNYAGLDKDALMAALKENSNKESIDIIRDTLLRVEDRIAAGIPMGGPGSGEPVSQKGKWWNPTIGQLGKGLFGGAKKIFSWGLNEAKQTGDRLNSVMRTGFGFAGSVLSFGTAKMKVGVDKLRGFADVYVKGEKYPRLTAAKFKMGGYFNPEGRTIASFKDIGNGVKDANGEWLLKPDEIENSYVKEGLGEKFVKLSIKLASIGIDTATSIGKEVNKLVPKIFSGAMGVLGFGGKTIRQIAQNVLDGPIDVCVKGREGVVVLSAYGMRNGIYRSVKSGKVISKFSEIDGPVLGPDGNGGWKTLITEDDIHLGLVDPAGKPIKTGIGKIGSLIGTVARWGSSALMAGIAKVDKLITGAFGIGKSILGTLIGPDGFIIAGGKRIVNRLTEIRDLLDERLPKAKKIRKGSYEDLEARDKEKAKTKEDQEAKQERQSSGLGLFGKGAAALGALKGLFGGKKKEEEEEKSSGSGVVEAAEGAAAAGVGGWLMGKAKGGINAVKGLFGGGGKAAEGVATAAAKKPGLLSRGFGLAKGVAGKVLPAWAGKGMLGKLVAPLAIYSGLSSAKDLVTGESKSKLWDSFNVGMAALSLGEVTSMIAGAAGIAGGGGGALAGLGLLGQGALAAGSAIGGILLAPEVLIGAAIVGAGYGLYKGYKYLNKKKLTTLSKVRYVQYGFAPDDDKHFDTIMKLEDTLSDHIGYDQKGVAKLKDPNKIKVKDLMDGFEIDDKNDEQNMAWLTWFKSRFLPVYCGHLTALKAVAGKDDLGAVENLKAEEKQKYLSSVTGGQITSVYGVSDSPFKDLKSLPADSTVVSMVIQQAQTEIEKDQPDGAKKVAGAAVVGAAAVTAVNAPDGTKPTPPPGTASSTPAPGKAMTAASATALLSDTVGTQVFTASASIDPDLIASFSQGRINAATAVRYKTYGLTEMEMEKVRALAGLERFVGKFLTYDNNGLAGFNGSVAYIEQIMSVQFGAASEESSASSNWASWFKMRFLPVYLNWATAIKKKTNKSNPAEGDDAVNDSDQLEIATAVIGSKASRFGSTTSVWNVVISPWPGYALNSDVKTTDANMQALRELAKRLIVKDDASTTSGLARDAKDVAADKKAMAATGNNVEQKESFWDKVFGTKKADGSSTPNILQRAYNAVTGSSTGASPATTVGSSVGQPGNGTGGDINSLPVPKGAGMAGVKDLLMAVAKAVGVDPKTLFTFASIESGFNPNAKAGTSSAGGLFQFIDSTWQTMLKKYGAKYGIAPGTTQMDPRANALMGAEFLKWNYEQLQGVKKEISDTDLYIAHFMGTGGAKKFLSSDPSADATQLFPQAAKANQSIFYNGGVPRTVGEVYQELNRRVSKNRFSITGDGSEAVVDKTKGGNGAVTPPTAGTPNASPTTPTASGTPAPATASAPPSGSNDSALTPMTTGVGGPAIGTESPSTSQRSSASSQTATANYQQEVAHPAFGSIDDTLKQSLTVQEKSYEVLTNMLELLKGGSSLTPRSDASPNQPSADAPRPSSPAKEMPKAPISMSKVR